MQQVQRYCAVMCVRCVARATRVLFLSYGCYAHCTFYATAKEVLCLKSLAIGGEAWLSVEAFAALSPLVHSIRNMSLQAVTDAALPLLTAAGGSSSLSQLTVCFAGDESAEVLLGPFLETRERPPLENLHLNLCGSDSDIDWLVAAGNSGRLRAFCVTLVATERGRYTPLQRAVRAMRTCPGER